MCVRVLFCVFVQACVLMFSSMQGAKQARREPPRMRAKKERESYIANLRNRGACVRVRVYTCAWSGVAHVRWAQDSTRSGNGSCPRRWRAL